MPSPMGGMPPPMPLPPPMPVPPMGNPMMPPQSMPIQQGTAPVAPIMRSNAGRRKRFGDSLEGMLASRRPPMAASDQMGGMNIFTGQMPRRQMPRSQMMGGTAMQPPVRRMMGGGSVPVPRQTDIYGQPHMLAYINPTEASLLEGLGGMGTPGPGGVPQYNFFTDFFNAITGGGKSSNTGSGRNNPRGSSSSSSQSYTSPSNDPYAEDRPSTSQSTSDANRIAAESMIAGGGGTNLSGSGSTAMEKLVAAQQAQTQKDDGPPPDITGSFSSPPGLPPANSGMDYINQQFYKQQEEQRKNDEIRAAREAEAKAARDAAAALAAQEASFNQPSTQDDASNIDIFTTGDVVPIGDPSDASNIDILNTGTPIVGDPDDADNIINLEPPVEQIYYDMFGNPYKTQAAAQAADAEHLRKQQEAAAAESQRLALEEEARIQAEVAAREAKEQAERERIAKQAAAEAQMGLDPFGGGDIDNVAPLSAANIDLPEDVASALSNIVDPINTGLGDKSLDKAVTDATEEEDDRNFIQKFIDDIKDVPGNIVNDITMALDAGLFGSYDKMIENLKNAKNPDGSRKYTDEQIDKYIADTKETQRKQREKQERESAQDDDDGPTSVVDPCPEGFKLDPASGICVPVEEDDTEEDEDSGDDKEEDTSDDELSGVVRTPPPPTSYLDNPIKMIDNPIRAMNRGGSVGLNRAADNFLAAMGG